MKQPEIPPNETKRLDALAEYDLFDDPRGEVFDDLTWLASEILEVPICLISLVDRDRQRLLTRQGLDVAEIPRHISFSAHAILGDEPLVVTDASEDPRFSGNPLVVGQTGIRFYLGIPLRTPKGYNIGSLCLMDTRPRKVTERAIARLRVVARAVMAELAHRRERRRLNRELAASAQENQRKETLLTDLCCEIREPLAVVEGSTNILMEAEGLSDVHREDLGLIHQATSQVAQVIDNILIYQNAHDSKLPGKYEAINFRALLESVIESYDLLTKRKENQITLHVHEDVPHVFLTDPLIVRQILFNLVDNASRHTRHGTIEVGAHADPQSQAPVMLRIWVKDSGSGLNESQLLALERFIRTGEDQEMRSRAYSGLGLYLTHQLVKELGGNLRVTSKPEAGMTTTLLIPVTLPDDQVDAGEPLMMLSALVACTDPISQIMTTRFLRQLGHEVATVDSVEDLCRHCRERRRDLVIFDSSLGHEKLSAMVEALAGFQSEERKVAKVGIVANDNQHRIFSNLGIVEILMKPVTKTRLQQSLWTHVMDEVS
ncbi:GAF domain-containing protein [Sulfidibacter corallicola]|uniref:histidine kinase n=1 Tax=Sulfidibacter corallicola TaxID=2818388 RepID=A0A8A4TK71_SULCO|nr:ATP-binding protein [Sulfidibacter corallicola]QTD49271.1 GAF domain-containing protein [Sulfidibacter corallicola]